jgi:hypothetical protein
MRTALFGLALCAACLAQPTPVVEVVVPPSAAHPQDWLRPQIPDNPKPDYPSKPAASLAEFVAPEVISKSSSINTPALLTMSAATSPPCPLPSRNTSVHP